MTIISKGILLIICFAFTNIEALRTTSPSSFISGSDYNELRLSYPIDEKKTSRWLIIGGRQVIPGSVYRIAAQVLRKGIRGEDTDLTIRASITHNGQQVTFAKVLVQPGELSHILLKIPESSVHGEWRLRVEGREGEGQLPVFKNTTLLRFAPQFLTILIQTSRPVYNAGQTVRFRGVMLTRELKPYEGPVDVYILDPRGMVMRRWPSRQTGDGVVNLNFGLPDYPLLGNWTIQIQARQQIQNQTILVEHYFRPRFEVFVRLPPTFKVTDDVIEGVVVANMTNWRHVYGNCSIKLQMATNKDFPIPTHFETVFQDFVYDFKGVYSFHFPMELLTLKTGSLTDTVIRVFASVGDAFGWRIQDGWALARIVQEEAKVTFLGDQPLFFVPGMPLSVHVFISHSDDHPLGEEEFEHSTLSVTFISSETVTVAFNGTDLQNEGGVALCTIDLPETADTLEVSARFVSSSGLSGSARLVGKSYHSPRRRYLQVETSTYDAVPGEYIVLHVRNNFFTPHINYLVVSNGLVVYSGREPINDVSVPTITTFSLPAGADMSPVAKILVWVVDQNSEIIAHSIAVPISPLGRHEVSMRWNEHKDHTGGSVELKMLGEPGAFFATSSLWEETHNMDAGNDLDSARVLFHMMGFHDSAGRDLNFTVPHIRRAASRFRDGYGSSVRFFPTSNLGPDAPTTFNFSEVVFLTDAAIYYHPSKSSDITPCYEEFSCLTGSCYSVEERCDGIGNCPDSSDEIGCPTIIDPLRSFRLYRVSRLYRFYDPVDGDWAWKDIRGVGREIQVFPIPKRPQNWAFSMFAVGKEMGLGIIERKVQFDSAGPFLVTVEGPPVARMWEQVGLTVGLFNFHRYTVGVLVTLPYSPDYQSILVEANGVVSSYDPRRTEGFFQHLVWLSAGASTDVHIPIIFSRMGQIEVTVQGATQMMRDSQTIVIDVLPEGAVITQHTSVLLDLKDRAVVYQFLDIHLDETPIIPYSLLRKYVIGTPRGHVSVTGDVVGPAFPEIPVGEGNLLGFGVMGAETSAYNFAANIWSLHYLRLTNQVTDDITYKVLTAVNVDYAALCRYQSDTGGFSNWIGSEPSVWLTAHALKNLWIANFQDWENLIYIDPSIIEKGVSWLLDYQTERGSFTETPHYIHPLDPKVDPRSRKTIRPKWAPKYLNISLTAHVVIALQEVMTALEGNLHRRANLAKQRAVRYLEKALHNIHDPYDLAVVSWALIKADSEEKGYAFSALSKQKRIVGDRIYWSREPVTFNHLIYEDSQRPYLQPKSDNKWDAHAVEATAYALLVFIKSEGIGLDQENIVRFLASMRELDGGHISSVDSLAALEALVEYSYRARLRDVTEMSVSIEQSANPNHTIDIDLKNINNLAEMKVFDLDAVYGHLSVTGHGSGQALIQLDYSYGVDIPEELEVPAVPAFDFNINARFTGRNNSHVTIKSCQRWINIEDAETSGVTIVDIHLPSGYHIMQDELIAMVDSREVRDLRWALVSDTHVKFFFNKLDSDTTCFSYQIERWYPVSNHSRFNMAKVYELYQPERFSEALFEVYPLYTLDICEVCGSFQCPYCPFYSDSRLLRPSPFVNALTVITIHILLFGILGS